MHEVSLAESVLDLIEDCAKREGFTRVKSVVLEIGRLSTVEPEAMAFCFDAVMRGSIADGARLEIVMRAGQAWCLQCERTVEVPSRPVQCPHCGDYALQVTDGTEMRVKSLEVESGPELAGSQEGSVPSCA